jgi:hypothetical protein
MLASMARAKKPAAQAPPKAKAAAWLDDGTLYVLVARNAQRSTIVVRGGRQIAEQPAVSGAMRIVVLPSGAVVTASSAGKVKLVSADGKARAANLDRHVADLVVVDGVAYAPGAGRRLAKLDEATATWQPTGLREATLPYLAETEGHQTDDVEAVVAGARGPIATVHADSYHRVLVMEQVDGTWRRRALLDERSNAIAWSPDDDIVYSVGDEVFAITAKGKIARLGDGADDDRSLWSAQWARGALYAGTLGSALRVDTRTGAGTEVLPWGPEVPHNHSLFASPSGEHLAYVRGGQVFVLGGERFALARLR